MVRTNQHDIQTLYRIADEALGQFSNDLNPELMTAKVDGEGDETIFTLVWRIRNGIQK